MIKTDEIVLSGNLVSESMNIGFSGNLKPGSKLFQGEMPGAIPGPQGKTPQRGVDYWTDADKQGIVKDVLDSVGKHIWAEFKTDETLILKDDILSVNTTNNMEQDNTLPITSAGVYKTVGNIEALLKTI